jgi:hypothetical protein
VSMICEKTAARPNRREVVTSRSDSYPAGQPCRIGNWTNGLRGLPIGGADRRDTQRRFGSGSRPGTVQSRRPKSLQRLLHLFGRVPVRRLEVATEIRVLRAASAGLARNPAHFECIPLDEDRRIPPVASGADDPHARRKRARYLRPLSCWPIIRVWSSS